MPPFLVRYQPRGRRGHCLAVIYITHGQAMYPSAVITGTWWRVQRQVAGLTPALLQRAAHNARKRDEAQ